jgi:hypothetical protein
MRLVPRLILRCVDTYDWLSSYGYHLLRRKIAALLHTLSGPHTIGLKSEPQS